MAEENKLQLKVDPANEQGVYSNAVSIHVNPGEMVLDFGYMLPGATPAIVKVASRVNVSHATAKSLMDVLGQALEKAGETK